MTRQYSGPSRTRTFHSHRLQRYLEDIIPVIMLHNCIEAREEFEDPEEDMRRMYVLKLFNGLHEWNFGLFVQEIFKHEMKARKSHAEFAAG